MGSLGASYLPWSCRALGGGTTNRLGERPTGDPSTGDPLTGRGSGARIDAGKLGRSASSQVRAIPRQPVRFGTASLVLQRG